ncbi:NAD(P)(+) transhydrogenase (Re/Si-specific) subunit beta, partial [Xanthomonas oryzae pv. oryzae]
MNLSTAELLSWFVKTSYLVAATLFLPELHNVPLILAALAIGTGVAWWSAKKVA